MQNLDSKNISHLPLSVGAIVVAFFFSPDMSKVSCDRGDHNSGSIFQMYVSTFSSL